MSRHLLASFAVVAFLYLPVRLVQEANPEWRFVSWGLSLQAVGLTLLTVYRGWSTAGLRKFGFPVLFFLVAVPWPTIIEGPLIQALTTADTSATVEILGWIGIPAFQRGNIIELATGAVGIDEACSGIRSFQAALMISLLLGEMYRLRPGKRVALVIAGFLLSFFFNVFRTLLLVAIASRKGIATMQSWHDPAGVAVLVGCFCGIWILAAFFGVRFAGQTRSPSPARAENESFTPPTRAEPGRSENPFSALGALGLALVVWILIAEASVEAWYRAHEKALPKNQEWTIRWPRENPTFRELPMSEPAHRLLRYDEAMNASWLNEGAKWQVIMLRWKPGRTASGLAKGHTPEVCLTAAGRNLVASSELRKYEINGLRMPFRSFEVADEQTPLHVFYCLWDDRSSERSFKTTSMTYANRLRPVLDGERNTGQRSVELAVWGIQDMGAAEAAAIKELTTLVRVSP